MLATPTTTTVGSWAERSLRAVLILERYGIDQHKEEALPLEEACRAHNANPEQVAAELEAATAERRPAAGDWEQMPLDELTSHIVRRHHEYMKLELPRLRKKLDFMTARHGERDNSLLNRLHEVFLEIQGDIEQHLMKEEMVLFPAIEAMARAERANAGRPAFHCGSVQGPIFVMEHEHRMVIDALENMRRITNNYTPPDYACPNFRGVWHTLQEMDADLVEHIRLEDGFLHPRAKQLEAGLAAN